MMWLKKFRKSATDQTSMAFQWFNNPEDPMTSCDFFTCYGFHNWKFKVIIVLTTKLKWASDSPWSVAKINFNLFKRFL